MRIGCLFVPRMPLAALLRAEPELRGAPVAVCDGRGSRRRVVCCSREAFLAGVAPGMTAVGARGVLSDIELRPLSGAQVRSAQAALLDCARAFSPRVALADSGEVCLDLSGLGQLFASERKLGSALLAAAGKTGLEVMAGIASTRLCALMAARTSDGLSVIAPGAERAFLAPLPLALLDAPAELRATLDRFGIERLGQLAALPPGELGRRLGPGGLRLWRLARGEDSSPLIADPTPERCMEETDCPHPIDTLEPLLFVLRGVLERLARRLLTRALVARGLDLACGLDPAGCDERSLSLASPTAEAASWLAVVKLAFEEDPPRAPVASVRAAAQIEPARRVQLDLFAAAGPAPGKLDDTLARLAALCGDDRVGSPRPVDSHRPASFAMVPFGSQKDCCDAAAPAAEPDLRAIRPPEELEVVSNAGLPARLRGGWLRGRVSRVAGPWRLRGLWWESERLDRDYYEVEITGGAICRIYLDRNAQKWFVDGVRG